MDSEAYLSSAKHKIKKGKRYFTRVSEKKSTNAQDKDEFSNYKADILMLYVEAVSSLIPEKNFESEETSSMMDLFIELKNEFAAFRKDIYSRVDSFSKLICPTDDTIQNENPCPSLQREFNETELKSETSMYASVAQTSSAIPEGKFKVPDSVIKDKRVNPKVVINGARTFVIYAPKQLSSVEYDVICVTETWLCEDNDSWHLFDKRYLVYRTDRGSSSNSSRRGGGVLVAIKNVFLPVNWTFLA
ncbi:hypothetical protein AVEN_13283-1 [Araneus ventricosus]|uniref:Uncharacterized protein n=1 Tax=Araneus ventricosus TaxID=182803 RepID=A0A4Y2EVN4_ARAVE|nr:hypothetical protein AVEN_13283-1 [Araneus ventricosus]